ncbi:MAG TPA: alpha/beta hydrolase [Aquella sp.]|nr:alpha/beta hydrolase [Aquella sp.]
MILNHQPIDIKSHKYVPLFANVNGIRMHYRVFSEGMESTQVNCALPTMIVLHGGPGFVDHQVELPAWRVFSSSLQVIFLDQRGCGRTDDGDPDLWNLDQHGEDVFQFCKVLGIDHPIVAGLSWGGYVAMAYASKHPEHPTALIFCNTEAKVSIENIRDMLEKLGGKEVGDVAYTYYIAPETPGNFEKFIEKCVPFFSKTPLQLISPTRVNMPIRIKFIKEENSTFNFLPVLHKIQCPTLVIAGECDPCHPAQGAKEIFSHLLPERSQLCIIPDAGNPVYQDQPEKFREAVNNFLKTII